MSLYSKVDFTNIIESSKWAELVRRILKIDAWTVPTLQNNWTVLAGKSFGYRELRAINCVHIHGRLLPGAGSEINGTTVFTLPEGLRPSTNVSYSIVTDVVGAAGGRVIVYPSGTVDIYQADTAGTFYDFNIMVPLDH